MTNTPKDYKDYYNPHMQKNARKSAWYDDVTRVLTKCPFCDLKAKYFIHELEHTVLTVNLFPYIDGHLMVIPKRHIEKLVDISGAEWADFKKLLDLGIAVLKEGLGLENVNVLYRQGNKAGVSLGHIHIHIMPITPEFMRYEKGGFTYSFQDVALSPIEMAEKLRAACDKLC